MTLLRRIQKGIRLFWHITLRPLLHLIGDFIFLLIFFTIAVVARSKRKPFHVGLGPEPLINNVYHKAALKIYGYTAETFVNSVYYITDAFDFRGDQLPWPFKIFRDYFLFVRALFRYEALYIYFNGGPLGITRLKNFEALFCRLAKVRIVVMPYGSDVQDLGRAPNLLFRHATTRDYPGFKSRRALVAAQIDYWTTNADHVVSGCDWVYYMHHWDTLMLAHFCIDTSKWVPERSAVTKKKFSKSRPLRLLHAPNHTNIKGTKFFITAVNELRSEGLHIELILKTKAPNSEIKLAIQKSDVILDQLIVGWYAMFAIEAMSLRKPVICYLEPDLIELFEFANLVSGTEIPIIRSNIHNIKETLRAICNGKYDLAAIGRQSRQYIKKHHSLESIGQKFHLINQQLGIEPRHG